MKTIIAMTGLLISLFASFGANGQVAPSSTNQVVDGKREQAAVFNGHRYMIFTEALTWRDAKMACEDKGGHLVTFGDTYERDFVQRLTGLPATGAWIGMAAEGWQQRRLPKVKTLSSQQRFYELEGNDFNWIDGKRGLRLWKNGVVSEIEAGASQTLCVYIQPKDGLAQWDGDADAMRPYVCEWDK